MVSRVRDTRIIVWVTSEEKKKIQERMTEAGFTSCSAYARQALMNGQIIKKEFKELRTLNSALGKIGSNVNQIARRANERRYVPESDIAEIMQLLQQIFRVLDKELRRLMKD